MITIRCTHPEKPVSYTLIVGKTYSVGRKNCDISFNDDQSISRHHAEISVEHPMANTTDPMLTPTVLVTDLGSKFGTFANDGIERKSKMAMREGLNLSPGDRFKFGLQWNEYKIHYTPLIITPSTVKEELKTLKHNVMVLGGHVVQEWEPSCDYVVMNKLELTVKAVCALLAGKFIVTPAFFADMLVAVQTKKTIPDPNNFLPTCVEKNIPPGSTFSPINGRAELFKNKVFVFCTSKHMKKMSVAVEAGGGTCKILSDVSNRDLVKDNYILMKPSERDLLLADHGTKAAVETYTKGKRLVQDSELGLAAVNMSTQMNCNPFHSFIVPDSAQLASQTQPKDDRLDRTTIPATQEMNTQLSEDVDVKDVKIKAEQSSESLKRNLENKGESEPASKKRPAEAPLTRTREKRLRGKPDTPKKNTLSSLFDSSDEEDTVLVPATQTQKNASLGYDTSATLNPELDPDIEVIPASPDISIEDDSSREFKSPPRRSTRSQAPVIELSPSPTKKATTSSTIEQQASTSGSNKRKMRTPTPEKSPVKVEPLESQPATKKQKTKNGNQESEEKLVEEAGKLTIKQEIKDLLAPDDESALRPTVQEIFVPLPNIKRIEPKVEVVNGKSVKNFKTFRKVYPLSIQHNMSNTSLDQSLATSVLGGARKKLTFVVCDFSPSGLNIEPDVPDVDNVHPKIERRVTTENENPMEIEVIDEIDDVMPEMNRPEEATTSSNRSTRRITSRTTTTTAKNSRKKAAPEESENANNNSQRDTRQTRQRAVQNSVIFQSDDEDDTFQF